MYYNRIPSWNQNKQVNNHLPLLLYTVENLGYWCDPNIRFWVNAVNRSYSSSQWLLINYSCWSVVSMILKFRHNIHDKFDHCVLCNFGANTNKHVYLRSKSVFVSCLIRACELWHRPCLSFKTLSWRAVVTGCNRHTNPEIHCLQC